MRSKIIFLVISSNIATCINARNGDETNDALGVSQIYIPNLNSSI